MHSKNQVSETVATPLEVVEDVTPKVQKAKPREWGAVLRFLGAPRSAKVRRFTAVPKWMEHWLFLTALAGLVAVKLWDVLKG